MRLTHPARPEGPASLPAFSVGPASLPATGAVRSMIELLQRRASVQPTDDAYTFLDDGEREGERLSWAAVDQRSRAIAAAIQARVPKGARALVLCAPGLDFVPSFFGCLFAGVIGVPAYPPSGNRSDRSLLRLRGIARDAGVALVIGPSSVVERQASLSVEAPELTGIEWLSSDAVADSAASAWRAPNVGPKDLAFLQYTSGSTSEPRGVMVTHGNLLHNLAYAHELASYAPDDVSVSWLPVSHDMGLIQGVLQGVFSGFPAYLMTPAAFLQRPMRWLQAISRLRATCSGAPNFAYQLCVRRIPREQCGSLDLSTWRIAFNGSEPVRASTLRAFHGMFAESGFRWNAFRPSFGLAESTLLVSSGIGGSEDGPIACGVPQCETRVAIVNPSGAARCADEETGEIWVAGPSVAAGYWNRPDETRRAFEATLAETDEGPFLRTGDLGFLRDGQLYVTGRLKDVLILRGVKHHPQDLEASVEAAAPALRTGCCAAVSVAGGEAGRDAGPTGEERLIVVAEIDSRAMRASGVNGSTRFNVGALVSAVCCAVAEFHGVQVDAVMLIPAGTLPKTTSGKIQRYAVRAALLNRSLATVATWNPHSLPLGAMPAPYAADPNKRRSGPRVRPLAVETAG